MVRGLALGPGRRSEFFDPKVWGNPRPIEVRRGKSGHRRAGCHARFTASVGGARQGASTESVTENRQLLKIGKPNRTGMVKRWGKSPPRRRRRRRHEKPLPVQGKIGGWAARPIATGMLQPASLAQASSAGQVRRKAELREMTTEAPQGAEQNPAYRPQS